MTVLLHLSGSDSNHVKEKPSKQLNADLSKGLQFSL